MQFTGDNMSITTPLLQKGYPRKERQRGQLFTKTYVYEIDSAYADQYMPDDNAQDPQGEEGFIFSNCSIEPGNTPSTRLLFITYAPPNRGSSSSARKSIGSVTKRSSTSIAEDPIENHPDWSNSSFKESMTAKGFKTFLKFPIAYIRTEVKSASSTNYSVSLVKGNIGKKMAPPGLANASSSQWLGTGRETSTDGDLLEITDTYTYDVNNWTGAYLGES